MHAQTCRHSGGRTAPLEGRTDDHPNEHPEPARQPAIRLKRRINDVRTQTAELTALEDRQVPVQAKLAAAWTSFMFLYIYVDYLALYKPGFVDEILAGIVHEFDTGPTFVALALTLMAIPILMILLSTTLPARVNRTINLVVATLYIPVSIYNVSGEESWTYSYFYGLSIGLEVLLLAFILRSAWTWPRTPSPSMPDLVEPNRSQIQMGR
jgi:hypothetical protein